MGRGAGGTSILNGLRWSTSIIRVSSQQIGVGMNAKSKSELVAAKCHSCLSNLLSAGTAGGVGRRETLVWLETGVDWTSGCVKVAATWSDLRRLGANHYASLTNQAGASGTP